MNTLETSPETQTNPAAIKALFAYLLDGPIPGDNNGDLFDRAEAAWKLDSEFVLSQGGEIGTFKRDSVAYQLGSLPGLSIFVDVKTEAGPRNVQLRLLGTEPAFDISPVGQAASGDSETYAAYADQEVALLTSISSDR